MPSIAEEDVDVLVCDEDDKVKRQEPVAEGRIEYDIEIGLKWLKDRPSSRDCMVYRREVKH